MAPVGSLLLASFHLHALSVSFQSHRVRCHACMQDMMESELHPGLGVCQFFESPGFEPHPWPQSMSRPHGLWPYLYQHSVGEVVVAW